MPSENVKLFCLHSKYRLYRRNCYYYLIHPKRKNKKSFSKELEECFTHQQNASISTIFCFFASSLFFFYNAIRHNSKLKDKKIPSTTTAVWKDISNLYKYTIIHVYQGTTRPWAGTNDYATYHPVWSSRSKSYSFFFFPRQHSSPVGCLT
jgi:hypothetical protein